MKNQKGVSMITLIITIIVIIILAAIAFVGMDDATSGAQFSGFAQEFGDYALNFKADTVGDIQERYGIEGVTFTNPQLYWMAASGKDADDLTDGTIVPAGTLFAALGAALNDTDALAAEDRCYQITDSEVVGYDDNTKFYGDNLGTEKHYVSQKGLVFTVPGFPRLVDDEYRMYITADLYYDAGTDYANVSTVAAATSGDAITTKTASTEVAGS